MTGVGLILGAVALFAGAVWYAFHLQKKRSDGFQLFASEMGLDFNVDASEAIERFKEVDFLAR